MQPTVLWNGMPVLFWSWVRNVAEVYDDEVCAIKVCQLFSSIVFLPFTLCLCVCVRGPLVPFKGLLSLTTFDSKNVYLLHNGQSVPHGVARILKLPGNQNFTLPVMAVHRGV